MNLQPRAANPVQELPRINRRANHLRRKLHQDLDPRASPDHFLHSVENQGLATLGVDFYEVDRSLDQFIEGSGLDLNRPGDPRVRRITENAVAAEVVPELAQGHFAARVQRGNVVRLYNVLVTVELDVFLENF